MKLAVVTAGAVGGYFGGLLAAMGAEITFVARGAHLQALQQDGLTLKKPDGDLHLTPEQYRVTDRAAQAVRGADMVLFAVKSYDTHSVALSLLPGLGETVPVLSLQNGVENEETLAALVEPRRTAGGVAYVLSRISGPGEITADNTGRLAVAAYSVAGGPVAHLNDFARLCQEAGIGLEITPDIARLKWSKLVFNSALNGWTAYRNAPLDRVLADPEDRQGYEETLRETYEVALALGVHLDPEMVEQVMARSLRMGAAGSSMLTDREMGRRLEFEALNGYVARKGRELGIPTPYNAMLARELAAVDASNR